MAGRLRVGVIFGGRSGEHEVSLASAFSVMRALDPERYEVVPIGIDKGGRWLVGGAAWGRLRAAAKLAIGPGDEESVPQGRLPSATGATELAPATDGTWQAAPAGWCRQLEVVFPVLHGPYGEDGTVQGLLELAGVPYVGAGVTASALCMDKVQCKRVLAAAGVPQVAFVDVLRREWETDPAAVRQRVEALGYPCFVKPANLGSSVGISKVHDAGELAEALTDAARFDRKVIVEQGLENAREIEISVLGNDDPVASVPGEIVPCHEFYDYEAKYLAGASEAVIPADLPPAVTAEIQRLAVLAYRTLDIAGMARIDFLVTRESNEVYLNEPNTLPGFTPISMYPKLWEASGLPYPMLLDRLLELALERFADRSRSAVSI